MGQPRDIAQHRTVSDRIAACRDTIRDLSITLPVLVDSVTVGCGKPEHGNRCGAPNFERLYCSWPLRFYILGHDARVLRKCISESEYVSVGAIEGFIDSAVLGVIPPANAK